MEPGATLRSFIKTFVESTGTLSKVQQQSDRPAPAIQRFRYSGRPGRFEPPRTKDGIFTNGEFPESLSPFQTEPDQNYNSSKHS